MALSVSERQKKYNAEHERVDIKLVIGTKDRIRALGYTSIQAFATQALMEKLEREEANFRGDSKK